MSDLPRTNDPAPEGTVTILFTDVEGSTDLRTRVGDRAAHEVLREHEALVRTALDEHGGTRVKALGDGFMAAFRSPSSALACAVAIQRAIEDGAGDGVRVRIGLNSGEVIEEAGDVHGTAVNAAARVAAKARGGQILVASVVKDLVGTQPGLAFVDRGLFWLKGFPDRWRLYEVVWRDVDAVARVPTAATERTAFVGRENERADLRRMLDDARAGKGALVLLGGEPGVGKTRLAEELAEEAASRGMMTLVGHCYETEGSPAFLPFVEVLESAARQVSMETLREALGESAAEVARILPELRRRFPDIPPPVELPPEQARRFLFNSIRELLERASRMQPLLVLLDDLHWADESSLLLLEHVAQSLPEMPTLVVGTYRDVELEVTRPLARTVEGLLRRRLARRVAIRRLREEDVASMLAALGGEGPPPSLVRAVYDETEGNPFFVEEVFRHLSEEGRLLDEHGRWRADLAIGELDVPESVRLVIGRRLERLSEGTRAVLAVAAVIGRAFAFNLLEACEPEDPDALVDAIDEAERARLVTSSGDGADVRFTFAHELIRQTLLSTVTALKRQRLHARVAEAIERVHASELAEHAPDLVHHLTQAGGGRDPGRIARFLVLAGDRSMEASAFEEALRYYENALSTVAEDDRRARADLLHKLGKALRSQGRRDDAVRRWRQAMDLYAELGDPEAIGSVAWDAAFQLGWAGEWTDAVEMVQRGLLALGESVAPQRADLLALGGVVISVAGAYRSGTDMIDEGVELARHLGDDHLLGRVLSARAISHQSQMEFVKAREDGFAAMELLRDARGVWDHANVAGFVAFNLMYSGRLDEAERLADELDPIARRIGHSGATLFAHRTRSNLAWLRTGDADALEEAVQADLAFCREHDLPWVSQSLSWLGMVLFQKGRWDEAVDRAVEGAELDPPGAFRFSGAVAAMYLAYTGREDAFDAAVEAARSELPSEAPPNPWGSWVWGLALAEAYAVLGRWKEAGELYPVMVAAMRTGAVNPTFGSRLLETVAGVAAAGANDADARDRHFARAFDLADGVPIPVEQAEARRLFATALLASGERQDRERAAPLLDEAAARYERLGMPRHVEHVHALADKVRS